MDKKQKREKLIQLKKKMLEADLPLKEAANRLVFGQGNADADVMFIGEGPGRWEDEKGLPFVGNAGALLNQALRKIGLPREEVFITNVVHYRPPGNRDPEEEELAAFRPFLDKMIDIIEPKIIVTLGRFSMAKFLPGVMISRVHGKKYEKDWKGKKIIVIPMYHPAAGLRNGDIKRQLLDDFEKIKLVLEEEPEEGIEQMELV
jgi:uracil-DNA glycosylase family 4